MAVTPVNGTIPGGMPGTGESGGGALGMLGSIGSFLSASNPFMMGLQALGGLFGGGGGAAASQENLDRGRSDIFGLAGHQGPIGFNTGFGFTGKNGFQFNPMMQQQQGMLGQQNMGLLGGGLFHNASLQQALGQNDIAGALGQANQALSTQFDPNAFGTNMLPGMAQGLFGMGLQNQMMAGNQSGLQAQELASLRAAAQPQQDRMFNRLESSIFGRGAGLPQAQEGLRGFFEAQNQQDLGFQTEAFNRAMAQQGFLGNLGAQQLGMGGQFQQQGFGQGLEGLRQNQNAGLQRLGAAQGLLGFGGDLFASQFGLGLGGMDSLTSQAALGLQAGRAPWELQAGLLSGSGEHANALSGIASTPVSSGGGFLGGLFSDRRLKKNLNKVARMNGLDWYTWDWNDLAFEVGASNQPKFGVIADEVEAVMPEAVMTVNGYKQVNYDMILGAV